VLPHATCLQNLNNATTPLCCVLCLSVSVGLALFDIIEVAILAPLAASIMAISRYRCPVVAQYIELLEVIVGLSRNRHFLPYFFMVLNLHNNKLISLEPNFSSIKKFSRTPILSQ